MAVLRGAPQGAATDDADVERCVGFERKLYCPDCGIEYPVLSRATLLYGIHQTITVNDQPLLDSKIDEKLSRTSLILGIVSIFACSIFTGVPAIITGHIALKRAKAIPKQYGGKGQALAGLIMGYCSIGLLVPLLLPAMARAKSRGQEIACVNNIRLIEIGAILYADEHNGKWPKSLLVMSNELPTPEAFICPADTSKRVAKDWQTFSEANISYEFLTPGLEDPTNTSRVAVLKCPVHKNTTGYSDGSVRRSAPGRGNP